MLNPLKRLYLFSSTIVLLSICCVSTVLAGDYLNSSHGKIAIGVNRNSTSALGYSQGNCAHCHEQHATDLTGGPYNYSLFYDNYLSITSPPGPDGLCFKCHDGSTTTQKIAFSSYSYSYRAGNYAAGNTPNNISDFFDSTQVASYHHLDDIKTFISTDASVASWNYTAASNPCAACHNPHAAQGDPEGNSVNPKSSAARGWPLSRPSQHANSPWPLWGNDAIERMNNYTGAYQAPYRVGLATYEPDGDAVITNGSNLTDFVTFCTDCHTATPNTLNIANSSLLGRPLLPIDWTAVATGEKHGGVITTGSFCGDAPYGTTINRVLSCMDCHESHGSPNAYILRPEVNGVALTTTLLPGTPGPTPVGGPANGSTLPINTWSTLCNSCHLDDKQIIPTPGPPNCASTDTWFVVHHDPLAAACSADAPITPIAQADCTTLCHLTDPGHAGPYSCVDSTSNGGLIPPIPCDGCHYHGATYTVPNPPGPAATHTTF